MMPAATPLFESLLESAAVEVPEIFPLPAGSHWSIPHPGSLIGCTPVEISGAFSPALSPPLGPPPGGLTLLPFVGHFMYDQLLQFQAGTEIAIPTEAIAGLPLVKLFDENAYLHNNPDVAAALASDRVTSGYAHFITHGLLEGRDPSFLYSEAYYLANNEDVRQAVQRGLFQSGLEHFLTIGHQEMRDPSVRFQQNDYLLQNPDVAVAVNEGRLDSAFEHYIKYGAQEEGRLPRVTFGDFYPYYQDLLSFNPFTFSVNNPGALFNEAYYLRVYPDVAAAVNRGDFADGLQHFSRYGQYELRDPSTFFDHAYYVSANPDVAAAVNNGLYASGFEHYVLAGRFEYRNTVGVAPLPPGPFEGPPPLAPGISDGSPYFVPGPSEGLPF